MTSYLPIQNVGAWECDEQRVYSFAENRYLKMRADHVPERSAVDPNADSTPYTDKDDFPIPQFAFKYFEQYTLPDAVLQKKQTRAATIAGDYRVFDVVIVRRYDFRTKDRAEKYWPDVPASGERFILPKNTCW